MTADEQPVGCDLILEGGTVVTLDPERPVVEGGFVAIVGDRIVAVGDGYEISGYQAERVISCRGRLVMPGLVDCHNHLFQALGRTLGEGLPGWEWLSRFMWPYAAEITPEETEAAVYLGAVEAALAGTTSLLDHHYGRTDYDTTLAVASAIEEVGLRGVVARGVAGGYTVLAERQGLPRKAFPLTDEQELGITEACIKARPPGSRVAVWPGPINTVYTDQNLLASAVSLARSHGTGWHTHLSAPKSDPDVYRETYGLRPGMWLHREGLLGPDAVLAHATWVDDEEIDAIGSTRTAVVHCPMSNQYVPYGVMPMRRLLDAGATVALGTRRIDVRAPSGSLREHEDAGPHAPAGGSRPGGIVRRGGATHRHHRWSGGSRYRCWPLGHRGPGRRDRAGHEPCPSDPRSRSPHRLGLRGPGKRRDHEHRRWAGHRRGGTVYTGRSGRGDLLGSRPRPGTHRTDRARLASR